MSRGLIELLGINVLEVDDGTCSIDMEITSDALQPFGFVHGGINAVLAETAASIGASHQIEDNQIAFGMELNINHLKAKRQGTLIAKAVLRHAGKSSQVWEIDITDDADDLVAVSRCTMAVRQK
ncbi:PaaI family thioesterase [Jeotgalicoccus sp. ATCC 8456]|uniref:PaaI family thioesterase n=1 Tax=Jeotgalicoccus sp. ATCC 8456 TaxID=946435 RepID=UPI0018E64786|nr:PaaI family thioesterase [Jeotgalicoccus sp. ATCC 8456]QQD85952.1 PaaI family thioesterase [Jeotgalicoccus sp. ATCC 8456]